MPSAVSSPVLPAAPSSAEHPVLLRLDGITKRFPGVLALDGVSFDVRVGEVHAVCGENGAGKSTLMKVVSGQYQPDASVAPGDGGWANPYPFRPEYDYSCSGAVKAVGLGVNEWQVVMDSMQEFDLDCTMLAGRYTLLEQDCLAPFMEHCARRGNAIVVAGPFNSGILAGSNKFNYAEAPPQVVTRVHALAQTCAEFDVPLPAAALQFPLAHPAVVSCVAGARTADQLQQNLAWLAHPIPAALWQTLRERELLHPAAPVPA